MTYSKILSNQEEENLSLHQAIVKLLQEHGYPMPINQIAIELNRNEWCKKADGSEIKENQIHARIRRYPNLFQMLRMDGMMVSLVDIGSHEQIDESIHQTRLKEIMEEDIEKASRIKGVVNEYFEHSDQTQVPAKELMTLFIEKGIFDKNPKDGLLIRNFLRHLYRNERLDLIPQVYFEQKKVNKNWYFVDVEKLKQ